MTLKARITEDMKTAMRAHDAARLSTIRMLLAAIKQREVDERIELTDADVLSVIEKMVKQRKDSIAQFEAGRREDLAAPRSAPRSTCCTATCRRKRPTPRSTPRSRRRWRRPAPPGMAGMGKVMAILKPKLAGRADMGAVPRGQGRRLAAPRGDQAHRTGRLARIFAAFRSRSVAYN